MPLCDLRWGVALELKAASCRKYVSGAGVKLWELSSLLSSGAAVQRAIIFQCKARICRMVT